MYCVPLRKHDSRSTYAWDSYEIQATNDSSGHVGQNAVKTWNTSRIKQPSLIPIKELFTISSQKPRLDHHNYKIYTDYSTSKSAKSLRFPLQTTKYSI